MISTTISINHEGIVYENVTATQYNVIVMDINNAVLREEVDYEYTHPVTNESVVIVGEETIDQNSEPFTIKRIVLGKSGQPSPKNSAFFGHIYDSALNAFIPPKPTSFDIPFELEINMETYEWEIKNGITAYFDDGILRTYRSSDKSWQHVE